MFKFEQTDSTKDMASLDAAVTREDSIAKKIRIVIFVFVALGVLWSLSTSAFFWEARTSQEVFDNATSQIEREVEVSKTRILDLKKSQIEAQKDLAIDKLKAAADNADTGEIERLNSVLVDIDKNDDKIIVEINFTLAKR